ncbi:hypothetical protein J6590_048583 [Homalodisca vitripennis]|nr:hypothetical protein J6590_048583 [Homalodisca vitripennis]
MVEDCKFTAMHVVGAVLPAGERSHADLDDPVRPRQYTTDISLSHIRHAFIDVDKSPHTRLRE